jgi:hypothetical protein
MHLNVYISMYTCVLYVHTYIIHLFVYVRIGRGYVCVHQRAMVMDRPCAHALAGSWCGLGLTLEPLNRASPAHRRGPRAASARRRSTWRRRSTPTSARGTPRVSPCWSGYAPLRARRTRTMADALGRGFGAAQPVVRGGTADARARAHTCRHSLAPRGLGCRYGRPEGRFDTCIRMYMYMCVCVCVCVTRAYIHTLSI